MRFFLQLLIIVSVGSSCHDGATSQPQAGHADSTPAMSDTSVQKNEIIPGERLGSITIGLNADSIEPILGMPDMSDAAMGKAWLTWKSKHHPYVLNIYTAYKDTTLMVKTVQQIRTTSPFFKTTGGAQVGQSLLQIKQQFPAVAATDTYTEAGARYTLYDDVAAGIAFEIRADTCTGILIHKKRQRADVIYIMLHSDMKRQ